MITKLLLIRHGQTNANLKKRYSGHCDVALNSRGRAQAGKLRRRLKNELVGKIYASDKKRAIQTAQIVFQGQEVEKVKDLKEIHFGVFEGLTYKEIMKKYPVAYQRWLNDPFNIAIPRGENLTAFKKRIVRAFRKIISLNRNKTVAVVSHGGAISIYINHLLKSRDFWNKIPRSAALSIIEYKNGRAKIKLLNDTAHL